jgi:hypothetical protein
MTTTSCCGQRPRDITIGMSSTSLAFVYCERCEQRQWFRDGQPISLGDVKTQAAAEWNKRLSV